MNLDFQKIKSIKKIGSGKVRNLTVNKNHTFVTKNGIVTHNCDLASNKIMCLQSILEGKGIFLKKINKHIHPKNGFNIIATANTKGKGSDDGRFIGTNVLNEAFLERFAVTLEQQYPTIAIETKILTKTSESINLPMIGEHENFIKHLCTWSDIIRKTFADGGIDEVISTRRLVHILKAYSIFGKKDKAIKVCLNRFDDDTKTTFLELYDKIDAEFQQESETSENTESSDN